MNKEKYILRWLREVVELGDECPQGYITNRCGGCEVCAQAIEVIEALLSERKYSGWISVNDRLPKETGTYLVNIHQENDERGESGNFVIMAWYQKNPLLFVPKEIGWILLNEWYDLTPKLRENISHWMPLPTPPEVEE